MNRDTINSRSIKWEPYCFPNVFAYNCYGMLCCNSCLYVCVRFISHVISLYLFILFGYYLYLFICIVRVFILYVCIVLFGYLFILIYFVIFVYIVRVIMQTIRPDEGEAVLKTF